MMQDDDGLVEAIARAIFEAGEEHFPDEDGPKPWVGASGSDQKCAFTLARHALAAIEREGWKVVPVEPTGEMVDAEQQWRPEDYEERGCIWRSILAVAPKQG